MNRRFFLRHVPFVSGLTLALPTVLHGSPVHAETTPRLRQPHKNFVLIFSYFKTDTLEAKAVEPNFNWLKVDRYLDLETKFKREGLLFDVKKMAGNDGAEYHLTFKDFDSVMKYLDAANKLSDQAHRVSAGYEIKITIV